MSDRPSTSSHHYSRRSRSPDREREQEVSRSSRRRSRSRSRSPSESTSRKFSKHSHSHSSSRKDKDKERSSRHDDDRDRGNREEKEGKDLPEGVEEIDESDYFLKSNELKVWLSEVKGRKLDSLSGDDARRYFRKFVKSWNRGQLEDKYYKGIKSSSVSAATSSSYSWSFSKATQRELDDASSVRRSIEGSTIRPGSNSTSSNNRPTLGPTFPPPSTSSSSSGSALTALQNSREAQAVLAAQAKSERKDGYRKEARESREEERDNRSSGRERQMEKRREGNAVNKSIREDREGGGMVEIDEDTLMGGGSSFAAMVAARDRRPPTKRMQAQEEKAAYISDKVTEYRKKEDSTMDMFRALAAAKYGS